MELRDIEIYMDPFAPLRAGEIDLLLPWRRVRVATLEMSW